MAQTIRDISAHISGVKVDKFVVMPNHIHMILILEEGGTTLSTVDGQMKSAATRQIRKLCPEAQVWQGSFHDHVIRGQADYEKIWDYIDTNPMRWEMDCFYEK